MPQHVKAGKKYQKLILICISHKIQRSKNSVAEKIDTDKF